MQHIIYILTMLILVAADQFSKYLANIHIKPVGRMDFIPGFLEFSYTLNEGAAFGILQGWRWAFLIITVVTIAIMVVFYIRLPKMRQKPSVVVWSRIAVAVIAAGAIGNAIDRARNGYVVDFLSFEFMNFPVFNVADVCAVGGIILAAVIILFFFKDLPKEVKKETEQEKEEKDEAADKTE